MEFSAPGASTPTNQPKLYRHLVQVQVLVLVPVLVPVQVQVQVQVLH